MSFVGEFKKVSREEWIAKANADLKGKINAEEVMYKVEEGISLSPFLTDKDVILTESLGGPATMAGIKIVAPSANQANKKALEMLNSGAQVLAFDIDQDIDFDIIFKGIYLDMISVVLFCSHPNAVNRKLDHFIKENYPSKSTDVKVINIASLVNLSFDESFDTRLHKVANLLKSNENKLYLSVELKKDFLAQIAELRAIRKLAGTKNLCVMGQISSTAFEESDIHPLIISNYLLMSAYIGMADMAFGITYEDDRELARLCLNIHNILKEESGINFVTDPTAGAYIIEKLTAEMMETAGR